MRVGESFGEACRYCGSTTIIVSPPSSAGHCAVCSDEAAAWSSRLARAADRREEWARLDAVAEAAEARAEQRAQRWTRVSAGLGSAIKTAAAQPAAVARAAQGLVRQSQFRPTRTSQEA